MDLNFRETVGQVLFSENLEHGRYQGNDAWSAFKPTMRRLTPPFGVARRQVYGKKHGQRT
jgi:hypothetical protein